MVVSNLLETALYEWRRVLPADAVLTGSAVDWYKPNCLGLSRVIPAVLLAASEEQVVAIVQIADRYQVRIYTISTGHNWGYGSSLPVEDGCVILDLSRMTRISGMDEELGLITLEPGVTQKQLSEYLKSGGFNFFVPTTGAGPTASIVGNALERGFGMTPERDHFTGVTSVRAVLPSGAIYQPYLAELGAHEADGVYKWGIGPYVDGLFTQGCFGVVTSLQISLVRRPEHIEVFVFTQKDAAQFPKLVDTFRELSHDLRGPIGSVKLINQQQVEMTIGTRELGVGINSDFAWMGFGVVHCTRSMVRPIRAVIRRALGPQTARLVFLNNSRLRFLKGVSRILPSCINKMLAEPVERFQHLLEIVDGVPRGLELRLAYRHVPFDPEKQLDPIREGVALLWYAPVIPLKGETVRRMIAMIGETLEKYSFPTAMSITTLSEKCGMGVIPVIYKPIEEKDRAYECFRELWHRGVELGCHPYRINIAAMPEMTESRDSTYWNTVAQLKSAIDPNGILSPGRYTRTSEGATC